MYIHMYTHMIHDISRQVLPGNRSASLPIAGRFASALSATATTTTTTAATTTTTTTGSPRRTLLQA